MQGQVNKRENEWWSAALSSAIKSSFKGTEKCSLSLAVKRSWVINWVIIFLWSAWSKGEEGETVRTGNFWKEGEGQILSG